MPIEKHNLFKDEQTEKRVHEHLSNKNDIISEEDIEKVKTDIDSEGFIGSPAEEQDLPGSEVKNEEGSSTDNNDDEPRIETPWNILR